MIQAFVGCLVAAVHGWLLLFHVPCFVRFVVLPGLSCFLRVTQVTDMALHTI